MTDWGLLAIQAVGVFALTFLFCRSSHKRGHMLGYEEGFKSGHAIGLLDGRTPRFRTVSGTPDPRNPK